MSHPEQSVESRVMGPMDNGLPESDEELDAEQDAARMRFMRDRRRARSLPACTAALLGDGGARKRVQFADTLGLSLADVKHFSTTDEPLVPHAVLSRHQSFQAPAPQMHAQPMLLPCFPDPVDAQQRLHEQRVALEKVQVTQFEVRGQVLTRTEDAQAAVFIRYTFNEWLSHVDAPAVRVLNGRYTFSVLVPPLWSANAVHFALGLRSSEGEFWDNNGGRNFSLRYGYGRPQVHAQRDT
ncbi:protein phosphatase 1 regulatory subunit 3G [Periophthalmus magnuspinnatus]|uniref:protein phosphatase 1 regulatory subunit 3G n=1 Tax=Periophthalmus magnuspinnatus TaxID=409849 RepID=UPI00145C17F9|nr:protein phosphatase 1 regulatory subunit 3G [Periophthalmus magnuspinnatus]